MDIEYDDGYDQHQQQYQHSQQQQQQQTQDYKNIQQVPPVNSENIYQQNQFGFLKNRVGLEQNDVESEQNETDTSHQSEDDEQNYQPSEEVQSDVSDLVDERDEDIVPINLEEYMKSRHLYQQLIMKIPKILSAELNLKIEIIGTFIKNNFNKT